MTLKSTAILVAILALAGSSGSASATPPKSAGQTLLEQFPESLASADPERDIAFCPDNTCIRVRSATANADLQAWLLAYLFHFGDYYALSEWRSQVGSPVRIEGYPVALEHCLAQADALACRKAAFAEAKVSVVDTRTDEGETVEVDATFLPVGFESEKPEAPPRPESTHPR
ncbi:MAG: hypothetical protein ACREO3_12620 [Arenimonas sp.]